MAPVTEPDPDQINWDGSGPFADDAYALPESAGVPVEWSEPIMWTPEVSEMLEGYRTPDALYLHSIGQLPATMPKSPEQLPEGIEALSGDLASLGHTRLDPEQYAVPDQPWVETPDPWVPEAWVDRDGDPWEPPGTDLTLYPLKAGYMTPGALYVWRIMTAWEPGDDPDPDPPDDPDPDDPDPDPTDPAELVDAVLAFAGLPDAETTRATIRQHLSIVTMQVRGYTRGNGFAAGYPAPDLEAVIVSATARSAVNPTGATRLSFGELRTEPGVYNGFTLPELAILHGYRRRWA